MNSLFRTAARSNGANALSGCSFSVIRKFARVGSQPQSQSKQAAIGFLASKSFQNRSYSTGDNADPFGLQDSDYNNVSKTVLDKVGRNLHLTKCHPLNIIKTKIEEHFNTTYKDAQGKPLFKMFDNLSPKVSVASNFDSLLIPRDHVSRKPSDTYYFDKNTVLRTHTSAHQAELLNAGERAFLVAADVYRRDEIDATHYPIFHQMEGVRIFTREEFEKAEKTPEMQNMDSDKAFQKFAENELKKTLEGLVKHIFGNVEMRWVDAYFPFTEPSFELEIFFQGKWLEVLGCGVVHKKLMNNCSLGHLEGWAFGLGLERLAMVLFDIPDIRLFWSQDERFLSQFKSGKIVKFKPYSKFPPCIKDISFWLPNTTDPTTGAQRKEFNDNDFYELVREAAGDIVESVSLIDDFTHPKTGRRSKCYRINYRHMDRNLLNEEIDKIQFQLRDRVVAEMGVELR